MGEAAVRFVVGGVLVASFAILGDLFKPKSFAGLFGAAPSVALSVLILAVIRDGRTYAAIEARSMMVGGVAFLAYACTVRWFLRARPRRPAAHGGARRGRRLAGGGGGGLGARARGRVKIRLDPSPLRRTRWYGHALRFAAGGAITVATGLIGQAFGPVVSGLFLAFPAIFPVSVALMEKVEIEKVGGGAHHARRAALADAVGATLGSLGLLAFAVTIWQVVERLGPAAAVPMAALAWAIVAGGAWVLRRRATGRAARRRRPR